MQRSHQIIYYDVLVQKHAFSFSLNAVLVQTHLTFCVEQCASSTIHLIWITLDPKLSCFKRVKLFQRSIASLMGIQQPHLGKIVNPKIVTTGGTSSSHGIAAVMAKQNACNCTLRIAHPSHSQSGPQQQHGKHGAPAVSSIDQNITRTTVGGGFWTTITAARNKE